MYEYTYIAFKLDVEYKKTKNVYIQNYFKK